MSHWHRHTPFSTDHAQEWDERWEYTKPGAACRSFDVRVRAGKALDVLKLKGINLDNELFPLTSGRSTASSVSTRRLWRAPFLARII